MVLKIRDSRQLGVWLMGRNERCRLVETAWQCWVEYRQAQWNKIRIRQLRVRRVHCRIVGRTQTGRRV